MHPDSKTASGAPQARSEILNISPYVQGKSSLAGEEEPIKLSSNESPFGPCPAAIEAYQSIASRLHRYPDGSQDELRQAIAGVYQLNVDNIICGNGSDEILDLIYRSYLNPGDEIILSSNHFVMCSLYAKVQGANIIFADEHDFVTDVDDLLNKVTPRTRMVTLANPNNPTGTYLNNKQIRKIHSGLPSNVLFIIDSAYGEYVTPDDFDSGMDLVERYENVIVTRTFSKIYGLSALRLGWAYCPSAIIDILQRVRSPFNTNSAAMAAATAAVKDTAYIAKVKEHTAGWINRIENELSKLGIVITPSVANFYLLHFNQCEGKTAKSAAKFLESKNIIPRSMTTTEGEDVVRISVGLDSENEAVIAALQEYMS